MSNKPETTVTADETVETVETAAETKKADGIHGKLTAGEKKLYNALVKKGTVTIVVGTEEQIESKGYADVGINGIFWRLKYGVEYTVPKAVARQLSDGKYVVSVVGAF